MENPQDLITQYHAMVHWYVFVRLGGLLKFKKEVDGQFSMHPVHSSPISLLLIDSGLPKNTASMIQKVATLHSVFPDAVDRLFDSIQSLVLSLVDQVFDFPFFHCRMIH